MLLSRSFSAIYIDIVPLTVAFAPVYCRKQCASRHYAQHAHFIICRITSVNIQPLRGLAFADFLNIGAWFTAL